jgi:long-subunit acyl-CoA synthetase (AMP-forming)
MHSPSSTLNEDVCVELTINLQISITVLKAQPIISGKTDYRFVDSVGMLFPGVEAHVLKEDGSEADVNEAGELYVRSECVALGYWNDEKATQQAFIDDGWLRTGDLVRVDQNGCFS